ncbi:MAG: hypothetical protein ABR549_06450 [Mycobacteriales bacterium]
MADIAMTGRQKAYYGIRAAALLVFILAALLMPSGVPAGIAAGAAGIIGLLTCIGVNAGGPGERAGALEQGVRYEKVRAPQGDWPPYPDDKVVDGEVLKEQPE